MADLAKSRGRRVAPGVTPPVQPPPLPPHAVLARCVVCGGGVSTAAAACPHCGQPRTWMPRAGTVRIEGGVGGPMFWAMLGVMGVVLALAFMVAAYRA